MKLLALQSLRQDFFDALMGGSGGDIPEIAVDGGSGSATFVDASAGSSSSDNSISDTLRSGAAAQDVGWGTGVQDVVNGSPPILVDTNALSDRLRGVAAAYEHGAPGGDLVTGSGGGAFAGLTADPTITTGTLDWSTAFQAVAGAVGVLGGTIRGVSNGYNSLVGIKTGAGGTPAVGGNPGPSFLQRLLGPSTGTGVAPPSKTSSMGQLLVVGAVVGVGYLAFVHKRR